MTDWHEPANFIPGATRSPYRCRVNLNLYDAPDCTKLATQAATGRYLQIEAEHSTAIAVRLCEDDYPGWLALADREQLELTLDPYQPVRLDQSAIRDRVSQAIAFTEAAMAVPNVYLWGGTVAPNYDCSGLMQAAFASAGVWLPRDAYQQEAFTQPIDLSELEVGDLIFFGPPEKATHVGLYLDDDRYIHSSGKDQGRNGIGIDRVSGNGDRVSQRYRAQLRGAGRVVASYQPGQQPWLRSHPANQRV